MSCRFVLCRRQLDESWTSGGSGNSNSMAIPQFGGGGGGAGKWDQFAANEKCGRRGRALVRFCCFLRTKFLSKSPFFVDYVFCWCRIVLAGTSAAASPRLNPELSKSEGCIVAAFGERCKRNQTAKYATTQTGRVFTDTVIVLQRYHPLPPPPFLVPS